MQILAAHGNIGHLPTARKKANAEQTHLRIWQWGVAIVCVSYEVACGSKRAVGLLNKLIRIADVFDYVRCKNSIELFGGERQGLCVSTN